ncbi:MAG: hypothetical protein JSS44_08640 [Proteobacteria bacterium]|nr:hypothetical protein [Pseudomonadota bacterium]
MTKFLMPLLGDKRCIASGTLGDRHFISMWDTIEQVGMVKYAFLLGVFEIATLKPVYFVASETSAIFGDFSEAPHFLCVYDGESHGNCGASDDWKDAEKFFAEAFRIVSGRFGGPVHGVSRYVGVDTGI